MSGMKECLQEDGLKTWKQSKVLSTSIQDDKCRRQVDAAKKRAAAQNVDYPTFAAMVSAAHLQPVDRKGLAASGGVTEKNVPAWSFGCSGDTLQLEHQVKEGRCVSRDDVLQSLASIRNVSLKGDAKDQQQLPVAAIKSSRPSGLTADAFRKMWNCLAQESAVKRVEFLAGIEFPGIFKVEVPPGVLMEILETLHDVLSKELPAVPAAAVEILSSISKCSRFRISLKLMKCGSLLDLLFVDLRQRYGNESRIKHLQACYCAE